MEIAGVAIDVPLLNEMSARMEKDLRALEQKIWAEAGEEFNINSPVKLGQILFEKLDTRSAEENREDEVFLDRRRGPDRAGGEGISDPAPDARVSARSRS